MDAPRARWKAGECRDASKQKGSRGRIYLADPVPKRDAGREGGAHS